MKPTKKQIELYEFCKSIISSWEHSNDISSPTHEADLHEFIYSELDWLCNEDQEDIENLLWNLHKFIYSIK